MKLPHNEPLLYLQMVFWNVGSYCFILVYKMQDSTLVSDISIKTVDTGCKISISLHM